MAIDFTEKAKRYQAIDEINNKYHLKTSKTYFCIVKSNKSV
jgi:hypothetical protein